MPGNCIYIHELDTIKLGKALREGRLNKTYSTNSVCALNLLYIEIMKLVEELPR